MGRVKVNACAQLEAGAAIDYSLVGDYIEFHFGLIGVGDTDQTSFDIVLSPEVLSRFLAQGREALDRHQHGEGDDTEDW